MDIAAYIHIPFCLRKCPYCAFYSIAGEPPENHDRYLDALEAELGARASRHIPSGGASTIYIGGGTPTLLRPQALERLLRLVRDHLAGAHTTEITIEALPGTLTREKARILRSAVNRVTLGLQSTERAVLEGIGRAAELDALPHALQYLRAEGITNIGIDLILGLPGETLAGFRQGLEMMRDWNCAHISAYMLYVEQGTPFAEARTRVPHALATRRLFTALCAALRRRGFEHYEVSNFALPEHTCRHNSATWRREPLLGFGPGAVGTLYGRDAALRRYNHASLKAYCAAPLGAYTEEQLSAQDLFHEALLLGLRTSEGIAEDLADTFLDYMGAQRARALRRKLDGFVSSGLLTPGEGRYRTTMRGMLWLDSILVDLFM
ncbi:MAG: radical SAM family heme chaperone HemW [Spirochaetota bacterium]|jgi:oxygen-independent coproporphyrinogen-3 oxidase|nr:radical SAM family heme chaperone HemW [Spirochaetota bacterium]